MYVEFTFRNAGKGDALEAPGEEGSGGLVVVAGALEVGEEVSWDGGVGDFGAEEVVFVEEEDDGFVAEPFAVGEGFEKHH